MSTDVLMYWFDSLDQSAFAFLQFSGLVVIGVVLCEHILRLLSITYRPSWLLSHVADGAVWTARWIGRTLAHISSFYTYMQLHELGQTIIDLMLPIVRMLVSPFYVLLAYVQAALTYKHSYLIAGGTLTLIILPFALYDPWCQWLSSLLGLEPNYPLYSAIIAGVCFGGVCFAVLYNCTSHTESADTISQQKASFSTSKRQSRKLHSSTNMNTTSVPVAVVSPFTSAQQPLPDEADEAFVDEIPVSSRRRRQTTPK